MLNLILQRLVRVVINDDQESNQKCLYILSGNSLQKWGIGEGNDRVCQSNFESCMKIVVNDRFR